MSDGGIHSLYRRPRDGAEWAVCRHHDGHYTVRWGQNGLVLRVEEKIESYPDEMMDLIRIQIADGFEEAGKCRFEGNRLVMVQEPETCSEAIYWHIPSRDGTLPEETQAILDRLGGILVDLGIACVRNGQHWIGNWEFPRRSRLAGTLYPQNGPWPLLLLLALQRNVQVGISDEEGREISSLDDAIPALEFLGGNPEDEKFLEVAQALGLIVRLDLVETNLPDLYF